MLSMKHLLFITLCCLICFKTHAKENPRQILLRAEKALSSKKSISYSVSFRMKFFNNDDTVSLHAKVYLIRKPEDSVFGGFIWYSTDDTTYKFYDLTKVYYVEKKQRKATTYDAHHNEDWIINGNTSGEVVWKSFLKPDRLKKMADSANDVALLPDTLFDKRLCSRILIKSPDEEDFTNHQVLVFISKADNVPVYTRAIVQYQGNYQVREFRLKSYNFSDVDKSKFSAKQIPANYKIEAYKRNPEDTVFTLDSGVVAPLITGRSYQGGLKPDTINFKGHVTLLDFWYVACPYCIQALPEIEKVREKYKDNPNVRVYGVNSIDNDEKGIKRLPGFLEYNHMEYATELVTRELTRSYKLKAWPTFYIIDKNGVIFYATYGFSKILADELGRFIDKALNK
jgi:thiol-disulfide isomerase/thioredoxin